MIKFFDAQWKETDQARASYARELQVDTDGVIINSRTYAIRATAEKSPDHHMREDFACWRRKSHYPGWKPVELEVKHD